MSPSNPASYSLNWARSRVSELTRKYPRATRIVEESLEITDEDLAKYLAKGDALFPVLRGIIHAMDVYAQIHREQPNNRVAVDYLRSRISNIYSGVEIDRLDRRIKSLILKEQGLKGAGGGRYSDRLQLPLDFS
jgi:hypothetical protein